MTVILRLSKDLFSTAVTVVPDKVKPDAEPDKEGVTDSVSTIPDEPDEYTGVLLLLHEAEIVEDPPP